MSTTFRRGNDRTSKSSFLVVLYRYQFGFAAFSLSVILLLIIYLPKPWISTPFEESHSKYKSPKGQMSVKLTFHYLNTEAF